MYNTVKSQWKENQINFQLKYYITFEVHSSILTANLIDL